MKANLALLRSFGLASLLLALGACGGKSLAKGAPDPGAGGDGAAGSSSGGGTGGAGATAGTGSGGSGGGQAGSACAAFADDGGLSVRVELVNETMTTLYLGQTQATCDVAPVFSVTDASGAALRPPSYCRSACNSDFGGCPAICLSPQVTPIEPASSFLTTWSGLYDVDVDLPEACVRPDTGQRQCQRATRIMPGVFTFSAAAGSALVCQAAQGTCDACAYDEFGNCHLQNALIGGETRTASTTVELDQEYGVFPSAAPPAGSADAPLRATTAVRIVFKD